MGLLIVLLQPEGDKVIGMRAEGRLKKGQVFVYVRNDVHTGGKIRRILDLTGLTKQTTTFSKQIWGIAGLRDQNCARYFAGVICTSFRKKT